MNRDSQITSIAKIITTLEIINVIKCRKLEFKLKTIKGKER